MINLYVLISKLLKEVTTNVYHKKATSTAKMPYVIYKVSSTNFISEKEEVMLEIDIWDIRRDGYDVVSAVEAKADLIDAKLRKERHLDEHMFILFERVSRLDIPDVDENIERIQLRYRLIKYNR